MSTTPEFETDTLPRLSLAAPSGLSIPPSPPNGEPATLLPSGWNA
jgi:hypothetical protein